MLDMPFSCIIDWYHGKKNEDDTIRFLSFKEASHCMIPSQLALDSSPSHRPCLIDYSVGGSLLLILLVGLRQLSELVDAVLAPRILTAMDFLRCFSILQALGLSFHLSISIYI